MTSNLHTFSKRPLHTVVQRWLPPSRCTTSAWVLDQLDGDYIRLLNNSINSHGIKQQQQQQKTPQNPTNQTKKPPDFLQPLLLSSIGSNAPTPLTTQNLILSWVCLNRATTLYLPLVTMFLCIHAAPKKSVLSIPFYQWVQKATYSGVSQGLKILDRESTASPKTLIIDMLMH